MLKGIRIVAAGLAALALGGMLLAVPESVGISWYEPAAAFLAGLLLVALGVYKLRGGPYGAAGARARLRRPPSPSQRADRQPAGR
jgi:hypothetical protein